MAGDINPFVSIEADQKEDRNVISFGWIKVKIYGQNMIKFEKEYFKINKDIAKEYMPYLKTAEYTSDVVKTVRELTGFPFLQGIVKMTFHFYKALVK